MVRVTIDHRVEPVIVILLNGKAVMLSSLCPYLYLKTWAALSLGLGIIILHWQQSMEKLMYIWSTC